MITERSTLSSIINQIVVLSQKHKFSIDAQGIIRVEVNNRKVSPFLAIARQNGHVVFDEVEAAGKLQIHHTTAESVINAIENAPGHNPVIRRQLRELVYDTVIEDIFDGLDV